jgi:hypothetical protein
MLSQSVDIVLNAGFRADLPLIAVIPHAPVRRGCYAAVERLISKVGQFLTNIAMDDLHGCLIRLVFMRVPANVQVTGGDHDLSPVLAVCALPLPI